MEAPKTTDGHLKRQASWKFRRESSFFHWQDISSARNTKRAIYLQVSLLRLSPRAALARYQEGHEHGIILELTCNDKQTFFGVAPPAPRL